MLKAVSIIMALIHALFIAFLLYTNLFLQTAPLCNLFSLFAWVSAAIFHHYWARGVRSRTIILHGWFAVVYAWLTIGVLMIMIAGYAAFLCYQWPENHLLITQILSELFNNAMFIVFASFTTIYLALTLANETVIRRKLRAYRDETRKRQEEGHAQENQA